MANSLHFIQGQQEFLSRLLSVADSFLIVEYEATRPNPWGPYQPQRGGTETLTTFFASLLPNQTIGERSNIKDYGDQFRYISGFKPEQDFFVYAAQFGHGAILWGIVRGPNVPLPDREPLKSASWIRGACGAGAQVVTA